MVWEARGDDAFLSSHLVLSADSLIENGRFVSQPDDRQLPLPQGPDGRGVGRSRLAGHRAAARRRPRRGGAEPRRSAATPGSFTEPAPADVTWRRATVARGRTTTGRGRDGAGVHPAGLERPRSGEGRRLHGPRPDAAHRRLPRHPARGLPPVAAQLLRSFPAGSSRSATSQTNYAERYAGCGSRSRGSSSASTTATRLTVPHRRDRRRPGGLAVPRPVGRIVRRSGLRRDRAARPDQQQARRRRRDRTANIY